MSLKTLLLFLAIGIVSCSNTSHKVGNEVSCHSTEGAANADRACTESAESRLKKTKSTTSQPVKYTDKNGDVAFIPDGFSISENENEQAVRTGLVVIGTDGSEYVWVPTTETKLAVRDFGSYLYGGGIDDYWDDTKQPLYQSMLKSVRRFGGFYMGRYEASYGGGNSLSDYVPASKPVTRSQSGRIWVMFSPQNAAVACQNIYRDNATVQGFMPWGINWDTTLQWFIDSDSKTRKEVISDSSSWGNYSDDSFSPNARGNQTGAFERAKANNIYDMAGNNWEWTQERYGSSSYVMRGGGYSIMGGPCPGSYFPAAIRDPLPGSSHHPNVCFRVALFILEGNQSAD